MGVWRADRLLMDHRIQTQVGNWVSFSISLFFIYHDATTYKPPQGKPSWISLLKVWRERGNVREELEADLFSNVACMQATLWKWCFEQHFCFLGGGGGGSMESPWYLKPSQSFHHTCRLYDAACWPRIVWTDGRRCSWKALADRWRGQDMQMLVRFILIILTWVVWNEIFKNFMSQTMQRYLCTNLCIIKQETPFQKETHAFSCLDQAQLILPPTTPESHHKRIGHGFQATFFLHDMDYVRIMCLSVNFSVWPYTYACWLLGMGKVCIMLHAYIYACTCVHIIYITISEWSVVAGVFLRASRPWNEILLKCYVRIFLFCFVENIEGCAPISTCIFWAGCWNVLW